jgi:hypothetical protein
VKLIADAKGRLTAAELFKPGHTFDAAVQADGSIRVVELVEKTVPTVTVKVNRDGSFECPRLMSRAGVRAAVRADRDAQ